jgi:hypothetical protein
MVKRKIKKEKKKIKIAKIFRSSLPGPLKLESVGWWG